MASRRRGRDEETAAVGTVPPPLSLVPVDVVRRELVSRLSPTSTARLARASSTMRGVVAGTRRSPAFCCLTPVTSQEFAAYVYDRIALPMAQDLHAARYNTLREVSWLTRAGHVWTLVVFSHADEFARDGVVHVQVLRDTAYEEDDEVRVSTIEEAGEPEVLARRLMEDIRKTLQSSTLTDAGFPASQRVDSAAALSDEAMSERQSIEYTLYFDPAVYRYVIERRAQRAACEHDARTLDACVQRYLVLMMRAAFSPRTRRIRESLVDFVRDALGIAQ